MNQKVHNQTINLIWSIADDVLRDVYTRGKYRDLILPFTVLRRLDVLLVPTKEEVLQTYDFLQEQNIDDKSALKGVTKMEFYNHSNFTFETLLNDPSNIEVNLENYLDGFSENVQEIISKFKLRNQLETMQEAGITFALIEKYCSKDINLSPHESKNSKGEKLAGLSNLGMGYVFEELIRKFNEENNEEAGEHFTPREIIQLMTHMMFIPISKQLKENASYLIYDPACGSGGMLTEAESFVSELTNAKSQFELFGQEVNPETYAVCTSDMLIKGDNPENIAYGSTLGNDGFGDKKFDFMLSNPPYGKSWKIDYDAIVGDKKIILDHRFEVGVPGIKDGQLLFLMNMVSKMKNSTELGSRIATVHNGSALFTGDAGGGASEIRRHIIENDYLEAIIGLPKNMFYNTGINTYIWVLSNRKSQNRKGKVQLIDASEMYVKMRKALGDKSYELKAEHIDRITSIYLDFKEDENSKIFDNSDFGYNKITVERPLRLKVQFTQDGIDTLQFVDVISEEMQWCKERFGDDVYSNIKQHKEFIEKHFDTNEITITPANKKKLFDISVWKKQKELYKIGLSLLEHFENEIFMDYNLFIKEFDKTLKKLKFKLSASDKKQIINAISVRDEDAQKVIKKKDKNGTIHYEPDAELRDTENIPLKDDIDEYFKAEVLPHVSDAWIDYSKTVVGYEISFTKYFYKFTPLRELNDIEKDIKAIMDETQTQLSEIL